jgi:hypothetical protein
VRCNHQDDSKLSALFVLALALCHGLTPSPTVVHCFVSCALWSHRGQNADEVLARHETAPEESEPEKMSEADHFKRTWLCEESLLLFATHSLIHSFTHSLIHSFTHSLIHSLVVVVQC